MQIESHPPRDLAEPCRGVAFLALIMDFLWNFALLKFEKRLKTGSRKSGSLLTAKKRCYREHVKTYFEAVKLMFFAVRVGHSGCDILDHVATVLALILRDTVTVPLFVRKKLKKRLDGQMDTQIFVHFVYLFSKGGVVLYKKDTRMKGGART